MALSESSALDETPFTPPAALQWPLLEHLPGRLANCVSREQCRDLCRELLQQAQRELAARFTEDEPVEGLVHGRARFIDVLLCELWREQLDAQLAAGLCLVAVGGYGRGELHPCSDVDILVLVPAPLSEAARASIERLVSFLWDIGLEVGNSVRTVAECAEESAADVGVMTTLMESRRLAGSAELLGQMRAALAPEHVWPVREFFEAKVREQQERRLKANDTAYNLEPNVKTGPGGLRDIQTIGWVAKRHFGAESLDELVTHGFLTPSELRRLLQAQSFLWKVRFGLHMLTGRHEDRLLFDYQIKLSQTFGYEDASYTLAVEQLMQRYYRTIIDVTLLNELLLQLFREAILSSDEPPKPLNPRFQVRNDYLETVHEEVFSRQPGALLELFVLLQQNPQIRGVRANTIRAVVRNLWLIDEEFRQNPRNHRFFLEMLRAPRGVTHELRRMNDYGVLGRYIPAFGRVVGRMQYDLFHAYTVDAHTLFVLSNLRRLAMKEFDHELPLVSAIMQQLPKAEVAYLGALFHDIAKGRGGDHSELGSVDAEAFCLEQGMSRYDARLVAWLVKNHLLLSTSAQKQDIGDPQVINEFARLVGDETHLDYLYVLTCADVRATNPKLWNSWKASLFSEFYERVKRALRRGLETPIDQEELLRENQVAARTLLHARGVAGEAIERTWQRLPAAYFLRHSPEEIARHTGVLAEGEAGTDEALVSVEPISERGTTAVIIYAPHRRHGFARATAVLDQLGLNILDASITSVGNGFSLDSYHVLEEDGSAIADVERREEIERALWGSLQRPEEAPLAVSRRAPRQMRVFKTPTRIAISVDERNARSVLELTAGDRPGLLCDVGKVLWEERVDLLAAKISTFGERAEDVFYVCDRALRPLDEASAERLQHKLIESLDQRSG
ncbi:MAG TPA: [protein-PII] uridylyltransferase [Steroidobacteraceae bacterium]|jgi:[protein-PII] uridylyltransferase|nr:[protein-PII] uridylyltransferase [Steroidobacteraceae bacterium]